MNHAVLELQGLNKSFGALCATRDLSFRVKAYEIHALIGPNGAGKTTVVQQIYGALKPDAGRVLFNGLDISNLSVPDRARWHWPVISDQQCADGFYRFGKCDHRRASPPRAELSVSAACF